MSNHYVWCNDCSKSTSKIIRELYQSTDFTDIKYIGINTDHGLVILRDDGSYTLGFHGAMQSWWDYHISRCICNYKA